MSLSVKRAMSPQNRNTDEYRTPEASDRREVDGCNPKTRDLGLRGGVGTP